MLKEFKSLISKYGGNSQFEKKSTQEEKVNYFLLKRAIEIEYNDYKFNHRNMIDSFFNGFIIEKKTHAPKRARLNIKLWLYLLIEDIEVSTRKHHGI